MTRGIIITKSAGLDAEVHDLLSTRYGVSNQRVIAAAVAACHEHIRQARVEGRAEVIEEARTMLADLKRELAVRLRGINEADYFAYTAAVCALADELQPAESVALDPPVAP